MKSSNRDHQRNGGRDRQGPPITRAHPAVQEQENRIDGAVLAIFDIETSRELCRSGASRFARKPLHALPQPLVLLDSVDSE